MLEFASITKSLSSKSNKKNTNLQSRFNFYVINSCYQLRVRIGISKSICYSPELVKWGLLSNKSLRPSQLTHKNQIQLSQTLSTLPLPRHEEKKLRLHFRRKMFLCVTFRKGGSETMSRQDLKREMTFSDKSLEIYVTIESIVGVSIKKSHNSVGSSY